MSFLLLTNSNKILTFRATLTVLCIHTYIRILDRIQIEPITQVEKQQKDFVNELRRSIIHFCQSKYAWFTSFGRLDI